VFVNHVITLTAVLTRTTDRIQSSVPSPCPYFEAHRKPVSLAVTYIPTIFNETLGKWVKTGLKLAAKLGRRRSTDIEVDSERGSGSFGISITFIIEPPVISADNFDPRK